MENPLLLLAFVHMAKKYTIFVLFESIWLVMSFIVSVLNKYFPVVSVVIDVLLLSPIGRRFVVLEILHIDLPFKITLHFDLDNFKRIVDG